MKILVKEIRPQGLDFEKVIEPGEIGLLEDDLKFLRPLSLNVHVERVGNTVIAQTRVKTKMSFSCARCLEGIEYDTDKDLHFDYPVDKSTEFIDLGEDVRQEMILGLPARVLCREECKGLCLKCGVNLNNETCKCKN